MPNISLVYWHVDCIASKVKQSDVLERTLDQISVGAWVLLLQDLDHFLWLGLSLLTHQMDY